MLTITAVTEGDVEAIESVRCLWRAYSEFLRAGSHTACDIDRLDREIQSIPEPYAGSRGQVLLATLAGPGDAPVPQPAGTVAYYAFPHAASEAVCEIKRLFVPAALRGHGIGEALVREALRRAQKRSYVRACLDTMPAEMAPALRVYSRLGFRPMATPQNPGGDVVYLERAIP